MEAIKVKVDSKGTQKLTTRHLQLLPNWSQTLPRVGDPYLELPRRVEPKNKVQFDTQLTIVFNFCKSLDFITVNTRQNTHFPFLFYQEC